jgi:hypothetical protein
MTTTEKNRLIAEFMGAKNTPIIGNEVIHPISGHLISPKDEIYQADFNTLAGINNLPPTEKIRYFEEDLKYHSSWDWLMPVVEKIENTEDVSVVIENDNAYIQGVFNFSVFEDTKLKSVYSVVIKFIKWYNERRPQ